MSQLVPAAHSFKQPVGKTWLAQFIAMHLQ
jgi:hypothetical protein